MMVIKQLQNEHKKQYTLEYMSCIYQVFNIFIIPTSTYKYTNIVIIYTYLLKLTLTKYRYTQTIIK